MYTYKIYRDGELLKTFKDQKNDEKTFGYMLKIQGQSVSYAQKYGGYKITVTNQETNETKKY